ncbi:ABC transporter substrate-binding protein [Siccirubricoccus sp. KC 17139]|uniref:ABC transporter substrate-binding protein n=1 Tax=Siccirubricoccus soli TaxID=2899147 RepID=A0ABT1D4E1_9PROT|nr:ABC transporter substrate-binding protein [Siccirubricoccus soli]MCO6416796.1 ABC transporter substrate-binding protein [Siccirubricoccus soli]MCP2682931.1 ABC transporter substrate-binding protein [Siccirubricoccus soli]
MLRRHFTAGLTATALIPALPARAQGEKVLRVGMTAADIPTTTGQPSQGAEGIRFGGITGYDGLTNWDLSRGDQKARIRPGLAESWSTDPADRNRWTFRLRQGVKFHDGSEFNAEAVVWNLDKVMNKEAPQFDSAQAAQAATFVAPIASYRAVDGSTVEIITKEPIASLPYKLVSVFFSSPARWKELGGSWARFALNPSGTGPWKFDKVAPRERIEYVRNAQYWDSARIPKCDRLVVMPMPDPLTRGAALLSGQVDWIEAPSPDMIPRLRNAGMKIVTNPYPHVWPYLLSALPDSPFRDVRVRQAINLGLDRDGLVALLEGTAMAARGLVLPNDPWFGTPRFELRHDPREAKKLMQAAGYGPRNPCNATLLISTSGSGQMQPLPMNEAIKQGLAEIGINLRLEVLEWETLRGRRRSGAAAPENRGMHALNNSLGSAEPSALIDVSWSKRNPPVGVNWGYFADPKVDELAARAEVEFDPEKQDMLLAELHAACVDQALWAFIVHDLNPRAMSPRVKGFVQAQSWQQDLTTVEIA